MEIQLKDKNYKIEIEYKNNKNMYLRIKDDLSIYITCPKRIKEKEIINFIEKNKDNILKMIEKKEKVKLKEDEFLYLGNKYDICYINKKDIILGENKVFIPKNINIDKWYKKQAEIIFKEHLDICFNNFKRQIPYPNLKIRKMKTRWGVCNIKDKTITLNLELIKLNPKYLDYVIYHELSHLIYPNHQKEFWLLVEEHVKDYKKLRKEMKNII